MNTNVMQIAYNRYETDPVRRMSVVAPELLYDDFKLCFNNAKRGKYGRVYDRIDGNIIYEWLQKYSEERVQTVYPEGNYHPDIADNNERFRASNDDEFEKFRLSYIIGKMNKNENK